MRSCSAISSLTGFLVLAGFTGLVGPAARAQTTADEIYDLVRDDLTAIGVNLPVWMSQHITAVMAPGGIGAGSGITDDAGGFTLGVMTRVGLFNNFDDVGHGLEIVDIQHEMPSLVPWPQFGVTAGFNFGNGIQIGADVQFIPDMDLAADDLTLKASLISLGANLRFRVNKAKGAVPALLIGIGAAYYDGSFDVAGGYTHPYDETVEGHTAEGTVRIEAAPGVAWSIFQVVPEVRLAWDIAGVFRPYVGFGAGLSFGQVGDRFHVKATATLDRVDGAAVTEDPIVYEDDIVLFETDPALWTLRPHVGFDVLFGPMVLTAQLDLAVIGKDKIEGDFAEGAGSFDTTDGDYLFNENARGSQTQAALIGTVALRAQF